MAEEFQNEIKAPVLKIFWILKSLLTSAINLSDNGRFFKHLIFIYLVPQYLLILFYLNCVFFPPLILHQGICRQCLQTFLFVLLIKQNSSLIFSFAYLFKLCVSYLLFYIRHIAWCIFIRFVNKSYVLRYILLLLELN